VGIVGLIFYIKPLTSFFEFETLNLFQLCICVGIGFVSVIWFEIVKWIKRSSKDFGVEEYI
jgi:Ca2+-transporting ATPase